MNQYVLLFRAVNISGKNHLDNTLLKSLLSQKGCSNVVSYINSGNFCFSCDLEYDRVREMIDDILVANFSFNVNYYLGSYQDVKKMLDDFLESNFSEKGYYDNIIFPISVSVKQIELSLGATSQYDKYLLGDKCVYWSFDLANYRKSKWYFSSANCELSNQFTVRKISTVEKLLGKVK